MNLGQIFKHSFLETPDKTAIICDDKTLTYKELEDEIQRFVGVLKHFNIKKGDRVSFFMDNEIVLPVGFLACFRLGAIVVPSSYYNSAKELARESNSCKSKIYFTSKELYSRLENIKTDALSVKNVVVVDGDAKGDDYNLLDLYKSVKKDAEVIELDEKEMAMILYTSGSTGQPKGVTHTHKSLLANARNRVSFIKHTSDDVMFSASYLAHGAASSVILLPMLYCGGSCVFTKFHNLENYVEMIKRYLVTHLILSPMDYKSFVDLPNIIKDDFKSLKFAATGGNSIDVEIQKRFKKLIGTPLVLGLGMTECGGYITTPPEMKVKYGSLGKPVDGVELRVVDENGVEVKRLQTGELLVKSDTIMCCYYEDEANTKDAFVDGWFKSGDLVMCDEDGYYFFKGRKKNIIIRGTKNINPQEIEDILLKHPQVGATVVIGVENTEDIIAFVVPKDIKNHPSQSELEEFLQEWITQKKIPNRFMFLDSFPTNTTLGKIDMKKLKEMI